MSTRSNFVTLLTSNGLETWVPILKEVGVMELTDLQFLTAAVIDEISDKFKLPLIQKLKFTTYLEKGRLECQSATEVNRFETLSDLYSKKFETMKKLLDSNKITEAEFNSWRHQEFLSTFPHVCEHHLLFTGH